MKKTQEVTPKEDSRQTKRDQVDEEHKKEREGALVKALSSLPPGSLSNLVKNDNEMMLEALRNPTKEGMIGYSPGSGGGGSGFGRIHGTGKIDTGKRTTRIKIPF